MQAITDNTRSSLFTAECIRYANECDAMEARQREAKEILWQAVFFEEKPIQRPSFFNRFFRGITRKQA